MCIEFVIGHIERYSKIFSACICGGCICRIWNINVYKLILKHMCNVSDVLRIAFIESMRSVLDFALLITHRWMREVYDRPLIDIVEDVYCLYMAW